MKHKLIQKKFGFRKYVLEQLEGIFKRGLGNFEWLRNQNKKIHKKTKKNFIFISKSSSSSFSLFVEWSCLISLPSSSSSFIYLCNQKKKAKMKFLSSSSSSFQQLLLVLIVLNLWFSQVVESYPNGCNGHICSKSYCSPFTPM